METMWAVRKRPRAAGLVLEDVPVPAPGEDEVLVHVGVVDLRPLITAELGLDGYERAFELLGSGAACKIVLHPGHALAEAAA
jgi:NADPH:quinone reductase-like Zn-dependent oxidoreductase